MPKIVVCSLANLHKTVAEQGARDVVTLISEATPVDRPPSIAEDRHLFLEFHDITVPMEGMTPPSADHVHSVIDFAHRWDRQSPLVIHCFAGVSRSTAAAYISALTLNPDFNEEKLALDIRRISPTATPNMRLIEYADDILGRKGRMVSAIKRIGRGADAYEGVPFALGLDGRHQRL